MNRSIYFVPVALSAAVALAACSPRDNTTAGQKVDEAVAGAKQGMEDAKRATNEAATKVGTAATDATITTKINAALATDDKLKATRIERRHHQRTCRAHRHRA